MPKKDNTTMTVLDLGDVKKIAEGMGDKRSVLVGTIIGNASDFVSRSSPDGLTKSEGLSGAFEGLSASPDAVNSKKLFLPTEFHKPIADVLRPDGVASVSFVADFSLVKGTDGALSWDVKHVVAPYSVDPLADLRKRYEDARKPVQASAATEAPKTAARK